MSDELERDELLASESDLLAGLLAAGQTDEAELAKTAPVVEIARNGQPLFKFKVRPLKESEFERARDNATTPGEPNYRMGGLRMPGETSLTKMHSWAIYMATLPIRPGGPKLWDLKEAWKKYNVLNGPDLIEAVLVAGEKDRVYHIIEKISGYHYDGSATKAKEELAGN